MITPPETRATLRNRVKDGDGFGVFYNDAAGIVADLDRLARIEGLAERIETLHVLLTNHLPAAHWSADAIRQTIAFLDDWLTLLRPPAPAPTERT